MYKTHKDPHIGPTSNSKYTLMLRLFQRKMFSEKDFGIFWYLVGAKIMVNKNHFQFNRKSFFNFWKMIHFLDLNSYSCTHICEKSATAKHFSLLIALIYRRRSWILISDDTRRIPVEKILANRPNSDQYIRNLTRQNSVTTITGFLFHRWEFFAYASKIKSRVT